jgi:hypothetical protein
MADILDAAAQTYTRSIWQSSEEYVEIWLEKDALSGVFYQETAPYQVPLMVTRGYPSLTFLYDSAQTMVANGKPVHIYYFGDYDPSGVDISRNIEARLREFISEYKYPVSLEFTRVAVNKEQIAQYNLPTRPTKTSDARSKDFGDESVEVDAIPPNILRKMIKDCITAHLDLDELARTREIQALERQSLRAVSAKFREFGGDPIAFIGAMDELEPELL